MSNENETNDTSVENAEVTEAPEEASSDGATEAAAASATDASSDASGADEPSVAEAASLLMGITTPAEEQHASPGAHERDGLSDEQLLAMGVEPDVPPGGSLVGTFVALVVVVIIMGAGTIQLYNAVNNRVQEQQNAYVDPRLDDVRAAAREVLTTPGRVTDEEGNAGGVRSTVSQGMDILVSNPSYLGAHPMGDQGQANETLPVPEEFASRRAARRVAPVPSQPPAAPAPTGAHGHDHAGHNHAGHDHAGHDHAGHDHGAHDGHGH